MLFTFIICLSVIRLFSILCRVQSSEFVIENVVALNSTGGSSGDYGPATSAKLNSPNAVWVDTLGRLYIVDRGNNRVRLVDRHGSITNFAGTGTSSSTGDSYPATSATIRPFGICGDNTGSVYIVENPINKIRKVDNMSIISLFVGTGGSSAIPTASNGDGGPATSAMFIYGTYCVVGTGGSLYFASANEYKVKRVSEPTSIISTIAGTGVSGTTGDGGPATSATLKLPYSLYLDNANQLFISLYSGRKVRSMGLDSKVINNYAGTGSTEVTGDQGAASSATLSGIPFLGGDGTGRVFIASSNRVRMVTSEGTIDTIGGTGVAGYCGDLGPATSACFNGVTQLNVDEEGRLFVPESGNNVVRMMSELLSSVAPSVPPSFRPSIDPSPVPTGILSNAPSQVPSSPPSVPHSLGPSKNPSNSPTALPSNASVAAAAPSSSPSLASSVCPTIAPSAAPSVENTPQPGLSPTVAPTAANTFNPTLTSSSGVPITTIPTASPTSTDHPSPIPSAAPIEQSSLPTTIQSIEPTASPTTSPTASPTASPTLSPVVIAFNSSLVLRNVSSAVMDSTSQYVVAISVASTLQIRYQCVQFVSQGLATRPDNALNYEVSVVVQVTAAQSDLFAPLMDGSNSSASFNITQMYFTMRDRLIAATNSDTLTIAVRAYSVVYAAQYTLFVSNVTVVVSSFSVQEPPGDENNEEGDNGSDRSAAYENWLRVAPVLAILFGACLLLLCLYVTCIGIYYRDKYVYSARREVEEGSDSGFEQVRTYKGLSVGRVNKEELSV